MTMLRIPEAACAWWLLAQVLHWIETIWREIVSRIEGAL